MITSLLFLDKLNISFVDQASTTKIKIVTTSSNINPDFIDHKISTPLEALFSSLEEVMNVESISSEGISKIILEVGIDVDQDMLRFKLSNIIKGYFSKLPPGSQYPTITIERDLANSTPALSYSLYSAAAEKVNTTIYFLEDLLLPEIHSVEGVDKIIIEGVPKSELVVELSRSKMSQFGITHSFIIEKLSKLNKEIGAPNLNASGTYDSYIISSLPEDKLSSIFLKSIDNTPIFLGDVAIISEQPKSKDFIYRINGVDNIVLNIFTKEGSNSIDVVNVVKDKIETLTEKHTNAPTFFLNIDSTESLKIEIKNILIRIVISFSILCLLIILVYWNRNIVLIFLAVLSISFCINIILYSSLNVLINLYSLAGVAISFGLLIDNVLVVNDHYVKYGNLKVFKPIVTSTLTTAVALSLIFFLPQDEQSNLISFSKVIIINLTSSVVSSFVFVPLFHSHFPIYQQSNSSLSKRAIGHIGQIINAVSKKRAFVISGSILLFGFPVFLVPTSSFGENNTFVKNIKPKIDYALGGFSHLFYKNVYKNAKEVGNTKKKNEILVYVKLPIGSSLNQVDQIVRHFENSLSSFHPTEVDYFISRIPNGELGIMKIGLRNNPTFATYLENLLANQSQSIGGAQISIVGSGPGFLKSNSSNSQLFKVFIKGFNNATLKDFADDFIEFISPNPRVVDINSNANLDNSQDKLYSFVFEHKKENLGNLDVTSTDLQESLNLFDAGKKKVAKSRKNQDVMLKNTDDEGNKLWSIQNQVVYLDSLAISFNNLGSLKKEVAKQSINKSNQSYIKAIEWRYNGPNRFGRNFLFEHIEGFQKQLPLGYKIEVAKEESDLIDATLFKLVFVVLFLIYLITAIHFESLFLPLLIILLVPMSYIGIFFIFYFGDFVFDQGGVASFIIVSGITVNSLILILSEYKKLLIPDRGSVECYIHALNDKIKPIILTILTSILGLLPFILFNRKEPFWFSLSIGMIGGLLFSIVSLVVMIPAFLLKNKPR